MDTLFGEGQSGLTVVLFVITNEDETPSPVDRCLVDDGQSWLASARRDAAEPPTAEPAGGCAAVTGLSAASAVFLAGGTGCSRGGRRRSAGSPTPGTRDNASVNSASASTARTPAR